MTDWIVAILILVGTAFSFIAAVGVLRMPDFYSRLQSSTKAMTLGVGCTVLAAAFYFEDQGVVTHALLVAAFLTITAPVAAQMIGRAAYAENVAQWEGTIVDEFEGNEEDLRSETEPLHPDSAGPSAGGLSDRP